MGSWAAQILHEHGGKVSRGRGGQACGNGIGICLHASAHGAPASIAPKFGITPCPAPHKKSRSLQVVAVSDVNGAVVNMDGLDIEELRRHVDVHGHSLASFPDGESQRHVRPCSYWLSCATSLCCHALSHPLAVSSIPPSQGGHFEVPCLASFHPTTEPHPSAFPPFSAGSSIPKEDILKVPCDVLIPAAIGGVIDEDNAGDLQCKVGWAWTVRQ